VIDIHTSETSFKRVERFHEWFYGGDPFIQNGTFVMRVVLAKKAEVTSSVYPISRVECSDAHEELPCRVDASYRNFVTDYPNCRWLLRLEDDTFLNISLFYHYVMHLNRTYDGMETIVFRGHANPEAGGVIYIHGGCGWLCSRAFVDAHIKLNLTLVSLLKWARYHQQDTAQSIIVRLMFHDPEMWDEMGMQGYPCPQCRAPLIENGNWQSLPMCPDNQVVVRVRDLWALHTTSVHWGFIAFIRAIQYAPPELMLGRDPKAQRNFPCRQGPTSIIWNSTRRTLYFLKIDDLPVPLFSFETLHNDN
jgi:hypothetical protein